MFSALGTGDYQPRRIVEVADELGLDRESLLLHGHYIAKVPIDELKARAHQRDGALILVSAMSPTPHGEGKTTTSIGLADALRALGHRSAVCLREPSLGPYFGVKGGGTGAGRCQLFPAEDINLHFVGDMYGVEKANNLLAAMLDNHLHHGNDLGIDPRRIVWRRVLDLNDRALREIFVGLGGVAHGIPRKDGFNITPASEIMAILCLSEDFADLGRRLPEIVVGFTFKGAPVRAQDIHAAGAMQVLLRDAIHPNIVQTLAGTPAFVHGGPFANIAQGTNSAIATKLALKCCDYVVTEAGFGTDLGAEKFVDILCRAHGLKPRAVVIVATAKAVAWHGGGRKDGGLDNLEKHIENIEQFGLNPVVAINRFAEDADADLKAIVDRCARRGVEAVVCEHYARGAEGATGLAEAVIRAAAKRGRGGPRFAYPLTASLEKKIEAVARKCYGADGVDFDRAAETDLQLLEKHGFASLPVCIAKTPNSLSDVPTRRGRPRHFRITVNELRLAAGAGFIVVICGNIMTMPGLPKVPAAARITVDAEGRVSGLA